MSNLPYDPNQEPSILQGLNQGIEASQNMKLRAALGVADIGMRARTSAVSSFTPKKPTGLIDSKELDKISKALKETNSQLKSTQKLSEAGFEKLGKNVKKFNSKELKETDTLLKGIGDRLNNLPKAWEPSNNAVGKFRKTLIGVEKTMENIAGIKFGIDSVKILSNSFSQLGDEVARVNSTMQIMSQAGLDPSMVSTLKEFQNALASFDGKSVEQMSAGFVAQYAQVTESLSRIGTLIPEEIKQSTGQGLDYLGDYFDKIQNMVDKSLKNTVSSVEAVNATYTAMQAGIGTMPDGSTNQAVVDKTVTDALKLVATQGGDVNQVMELLVQTMTAFGMSANSSGEILAKLTKLVDVGITSIPELSMGFGQLGVSASSAGVTLDEMTGSLAALTLSGSNTFSAMTSLQNIYNKIIAGSPSDRLAEMNATIDGQAVRLDAATVASKGFAQALGDVDRAIGGSEQAWQKIWGGDSEAVRGTFGLLKKDIKGLQDVIEQVSNTSASYLEQAFNIKIDTDKVMQFSQALNKVSEIGLKLGKILTPLFSKGLERIDSYADKLDYLVKNYGDVILKIIEMQLALKTLNGVFGIIIGTMGKLLAAYAGYLMLSGKLFANLQKIGGILLTQNKAVKDNNMLWDKNTSMMKKVVGVIGQLLGFYDLEKSSKNELTKADQKQIDSTSKKRAVEAAAHDKKMAELKAEIDMYDKVEAVRSGKVDPKKAKTKEEEEIADKQTIYQQSQAAKERLKETSAQKKEAQKSLVGLNELEKQLDEEKQKVESDRNNPNRNEDLKAINESRKDVEAQKKARQQELRAIEYEQKKHQETIKKAHRADKNDPDVQISRRAMDNSKESKLKEEEARRTQKYYDDNKDKKEFQGRVIREKSIAQANDELTKKKAAKSEEIAKRRRKYLMELDENGESRLEVQQRLNPERAKRLARQKINSSGRVGQLGGSAIGNLATSATGGRAQTAIDVFDLMGDSINKFKDEGLTMAQSFGKMKTTIIGSLKNITTGALSFGKALLTVTGGLTLAAAAVVALGAAVVLTNEKNTKQAKDMLKEAGLDDSEIVSIGDALKKQFDNAIEYYGIQFGRFGKFLSDIVGGVFNIIKNNIKSIVGTWFGVGKVILAIANTLESTFIQIGNKFLDIIGNVPGMGGVKEFKVDEKDLSDRQSKRWDALNNAEKNLINSIDNADKNIAKGFGDLANTMTKSIDDWWYAVSGEASLDIAIGKIKEQQNELGTAIDANLNKAKQYKNVLVGGKFEDVNIGNEIDPQIVNVANVLKDALNKDVIKNEDMQTVDKTVDATRLMMQKTIDSLQGDISKTGKNAEILLGEKIQNSGLDDKGKGFLESYTRARASSQAKGQEYVSSTDAEKKVAEQVTGFSIENQKQLESLIKKQNELKLQGKKLEKDEQEQLNKLLEERTKLESQNLGYTIDQLANYEQQNEELNKAVKSVKDIEGAFSAAQAYIKNRVDVDGTSNPDAKRAINLNNSNIEQLGTVTSNFGRTMNVLSGEGGYSPEELINMQKEDPEKYKKILEENNVDFAKTAATFTDIATLIPKITESIQSNAASGFTDATKTADQLREAVEGTMRKALEAEGIMGEQADGMIKGLLADQNMRQTIAALEAADHEKRLERLAIEKSIYESLRDSQILSSERTLRKIQDLEKQSLDQNIEYTKSKMDELKQQDEDVIDPGLIKEWEDKYNKLINDRKVLEIKQIDEVTAHRIRSFDIQLKALEQLKQNEYLINEKSILDAQELNRKKIDEEIAAQERKVAMMIENKEDPEAIQNAQKELEILRNTTPTELNNIDEVTQNRISNFEREKRAYEELKASEYMISEELIRKIQDLENKSLTAQIDGQRRKIAKLKENGESQEAILKAEQDLTALLNREVVQRIQQQKELVEQQTKIITAEYDKRYGEIKEKIARGELNVSDDERIELETKKNEEIIKANIEAQEKIKEIIKKAGGDTRLIEAEIQQQRLNLIDAFVSKALQRYDNYAKGVEAAAQKESNALERSGRQLETRAQMMSKLEGLLSKQASVADEATGFRTRDLGMLAEKEKSPQKRKKIEKEILDLQEKGALRQLQIEKESMKLRHQQMDLEIKILEIRQKQAEIKAKSELQQAAINQQKVMADPNSTNADKMLAAATTQGAAVNYDATLAEGALIDFQKQINRREKELDNVSMYNREKATRYEYSERKKELKEKTWEDRINWIGGNKKRTPKYIEPSFTTPNIPNVSGGVGSGNVIAEIMNNGIGADLEKELKEMGEKNNKLEELKKQEEKVLNNPNATEEEKQKASQARQQLEKELGVNGDGQNIAKDQIKIQSEINKKLTLTNELLSVIAKTDMTGEYVDQLSELNMGIGEAIDDTVDNVKNPGKDSQLEISKSPSTITDADVDKFLEIHIKNMLAKSGKDSAERPNIYFDSERMRTIDVNNGKSEEGAGGWYTSADRSITQHSKDKEELKRLLAGEIGADDTYADNIFTHEARHWMQYEGLNNGWLNSKNLSGEDKKRAQEGIAYSGDNKFEQDAYTYEIQNHAELLAKSLEEARRTIEKNESYQASTSIPKARYIAGTTDMNVAKGNDGYVVEIQKTIEKLTLDLMRESELSNTMQRDVLAVLEKQFNHNLEVYNLQNSYLKLIEQQYNLQIENNGLFNNIAENCAIIANKVAEDSSDNKDSKFEKSNQFNNLEDKKLVDEEDLLSNKLEYDDTKKDGRQYASKNYAEQDLGLIYEQQLKIEKERAEKLKKIKELMVDFDIPLPKEQPKSKPKTPTGSSPYVGSPPYLIPTPEKAITGSIPNVGSPPYLMPTPEKPKQTGSGSLEDIKEYTTDQAKKGNLVNIQLSPEKLEEAMSKAFKPLFIDTKPNLPIPGGSSFQSGEESKPYGVMESGVKAQQETAMGWMKNNQNMPDNTNQIKQFYDLLKSNNLTNPSNQKDAKPKQENNIDIRPNIQITIQSEDEKKLAEQIAKKMDDHLLSLFTEAAKTL